MKFKLISAFILGNVVSVTGCDNTTVSNNNATVNLRPPPFFNVNANGACIGDCSNNKVINDQNNPDDTVKSNLLSDSKEPDQVNQKPEEKKRVIHEFRASFDSGSEVMHQTYDTKVNELVSKLAQYPNSQLSITGYADQSEANFQQLAIDRAKGLEQVLASYRIPHNRININSQVGRSNINDSNKKVVAVLTL